jgi:hypothetical protein
MQAYPGLNSTDVAHTTRAVRQHRDEHLQSSEPELLMVM